MKLKSHHASIFIPDSVTERTAFERVTHMGIGAHADDLEIMSFHGIKECVDHPHQWFSGIICTNGEGSPRVDKYLSKSNQEMIQIRKSEQEKAAKIGRYSVVFQLGYHSSILKNSDSYQLIDDLVSILKRTKPGVIYTHNPFDKHRTHVAIFGAVIQALRRLDPTDRPHSVYGCEAWRSLDWLLDSDKVVHNLSGRNQLAVSLLKTFDSQIGGGKRYDKAVIGRRQGNATFFNPHSPDASDQLAFAMDLTPLIMDDHIRVLDFVMGFIHHFRQRAESTLKKVMNEMMDQGE